LSSETTTASPPRAGAVACNVCGTPTPVGQPAVWLKDGFEIVRCGECGLLFRREMPSGAELPEIYSEEYFRRPDGSHDAQGYRDYLADETEHRLNARRRLDWLAGVRAPGTLFDVGAAAGFFVDEASRRGWRASGIDVSAPMAQFARERLGADVRTGSFQDLAVNPGTVDCVTMWDYIEHSTDAAQDVALAARALRAGGLLVLSTGDAGSLVARLSGPRWHLLTPHHHNFFFTVPALERLLRRFGLEPFACRHRPAYYSLAYLVHKLGTMVPANRALARASDQFARTRFGQAPIPVNLWDIVTIAARKQG
jgi:2-polyprenyl-3-methyl-5-hydroxy-6-metoxy-1,4-benzoquinol methylase